MRGDEKRARGTTVSAEPLAEHLLPEINQRVTIAVEGISPVSSRIEDVRSEFIQLAYPAIDLEFADVVTIAWERDGVWMSFVTTVTGVDAQAAVPTILVSSSGRLSRFDHERRDVMRYIELPIELQIVSSRVARVGRSLHTHTNKIGSDSVTFLTTAQFAPGDLLEASIALGTSTNDLVRARVRVVRTEISSGSLRSTCQAVFDEILRSDRAHLMAFVTATGTAVVPAEPPTIDGVGGRDEPRSLSDLEGVLDWIARDRSEREQQTQDH